MHYQHLLFAAPVAKIIVYVQCRNTGRCLEAKGAQFVRPLVPDNEDYFVLKPMHSAFYMTPLEVLLKHLQVEALILIGLTSNSCITVTAHDANRRGFDVYIPPDCSCARNFEEHALALAQLMAGADLRLSTALRLPPSEHMRPRNHTHRELHVHRSLKCIAIQLFVTLLRMRIAQVQQCSRVCHGRRQAQHRFHPCRQLIPTGTA